MECIKRHQDLLRWLAGQQTWGKPEGKAFYLKSIFEPVNWHICGHCKHPNLSVYWKISREFRNHNCLPLFTKDEMCLGECFWYSSIRRSHSSYNATNESSRPSLQSNVLFGISPTDFPSTIWFSFARRNGMLSLFAIVPWETKYKSYRRKQIE